MPLQSPFKYKILPKTNKSINGNPFIEEFNQKIINASSTTVELSDGKTIRKSDMAIPKLNFSKIRSFKTNILFPYLPNSNVEVSPRRAKLWKSNKPKKQQPKTGNRKELGTSDNNTSKRVSRPSTNPSRRQPPPI